MSVRRRRRRSYDDDDYDDDYDDYDDHNDDNDDYVLQQRKSPKRSKSSSSSKHRRSKQEYIISSEIEVHESDQGTSIINKTPISITQERGITDIESIKKRLAEKKRKLEYDRDHNPLSQKSDKVFNEGNFTQQLGVMSCTEIREFLEKTKLTDEEKISFVEQNLKATKHLQSYIKNLNYNPHEMQVMGEAAAGVMSLLHHDIKEKFGILFDSYDTTDPDCVYLRELVARIKKRRKYSKVGKAFQVVKGAVVGTASLVGNAIATGWSYMAPLVSSLFKAGFDLVKYIMSNPLTAFCALSLVKDMRDMACRQAGIYLGKLSKDNAFGSRAFLEDVLKKHYPDIVMTRGKTNLQDLMGIFNEIKQPFMNRIAGVFVVQSTEVGMTAFGEFLSGGIEILPAIPVIGDALGGVIKVIGMVIKASAKEVGKQIGDMIEVGIHNQDVKNCFTKLFEIIDLSTCMKALMEEVNNEFDTAHSTTMNPLQIQRAQNEADKKAKDAGKAVSDLEEKLKKASTAEDREKLQAELTDAKAKADDTKKLFESTKEASTKDTEQQIQQDMKDVEFMTSKREENNVIQKSIFDIRDKLPNLKRNVEIDTEQKKEVETKYVLALETLNKLQKEYPAFEAKNKESRRRYDELDKKGKGRTYNEFYEMDKLKGEMINMPGLVDSRAKNLQDAKDEVRYLKDEVKQKEIKLFENTELLKNAEAALVEATNNFKTKKSDYVREAADYVTKKQAGGGESKKKFSGDLHSKRARKRKNRVHTINRKRGKKHVKSKRKFQNYKSIFKLFQNS